MIDVATRAEAEAFAAGDPYTIAGVASYTVIEFNLARCVSRPVCPRSKGRSGRSGHPFVAHPPPGINGRWTRRRRRSQMIVRHDDGSLTVPVARDRHADEGDEVIGGRSRPTMVMRPGEGGYAEALAEWDRQQHPDRGEAVSTASGREEAMAVVHAVAEDPKHVDEAVDALDDPDASAEALRHVLVGGTPSVQAFASEVADAEGGDAAASAQGDEDHRRGAGRDRRLADRAQGRPVATRIPLGNAHDPLRRSAVIGALVLRSYSSCVRRRCTIRARRPSRP